MFLEPDVWIGKVNIDALGAMRGKQAEIHRGSRQRNIGPPQEAGYTSAIATSKPEPNRPLQLGGVHIYPHMSLVLHAFNGRFQPFLDIRLRASTMRRPCRKGG
jgi:hypothetical protein